jgi:hypothetical protein
MTENPRPRDEAELVELIRSVDASAPPQLHERVEAMVADRQRGGARRGAGAWRVPTLRLRLGAAATGLAAVVAALALALSGSGGGGGLGLAQAAAVTLRAPTMAAPAESSAERTQLTAAVEGISFPYWSERFGWHAAGSRVDRLDGRTLRTVFYSDGHGHTVGYAIVSGTHAPTVGGGSVAWRAGTAYRLHRVDGAEVVSWTRAGHLCVVSGRGVDGRTLLTLASWDEQPRTS